MPSDLPHCRQRDTKTAAAKHLLWVQQQVFTNKVGLRAPQGNRQQSCSGKKLSVCCCWPHPPGRCPRRPHQPGGGPGPLHPAHGGRQRPGPTCSSESPASVRQSNQDQASFVKRASYNMCTCCLFMYKQGFMQEWPAGCHPACWLLSYWQRGITEQTICCNCWLILLLRSADVACRLCTAAEDCCSCQMPSTLLELFL